jgi:hypothetical protein
MSGDALYTLSNYSNPAKMFISGKICPEGRKEFSYLSRSNPSFSRERAGGLPGKIGR